MSLNDYLKCPGLDRSLTAVPNDYPCPDCGNPVEIWTDEKKARCPNCGAVVDSNHQHPSDHGCHEQIRRKVITPAQRNQLVQAAIPLGAGDAAIISSVKIVVENDLANLCGTAPRCENYNLSPSCPPHVLGPSWFRKLQQQSTYSIVIRIDAPTAAMFSDERREIMKLLNEIVAGIEKMAAGMGYNGSKAFAGGSCKKIFCHEYETCRILSGRDECRNPQSARPSMSGFGINVTELMHTAGWPAPKATPDQAADSQSMTWVAGLIVITDSEN